MRSWKAGSWSWRNEKWLEILGGRLGGREGDGEWEEREDKQGGEGEWMR